MDWKHANILIVEDNESDIQLIKNFFKEESLSNNYTICGTIAEAEQALATETYNVAFVDMNLIDGCGLELLPKINPAVTSVVMLSGLKDTDALLGARELGAKGFIEKPLHWESLRLLINSMESLSLSIVVKDGVL